jgi:hypothetical protein
MLRSIKELTSYSLLLDEERAGRCRDFLFDDKEWVLRYAVVDLQPSHKSVLLPPSRLGEADWEKQLFHLKLSRKQLDSSPGLDENAPVSRVKEREFATHFGWEPYYIRLSFPRTPTPMGTKEESGGAATSVEHEPDVHLRSVDEVIGYRIEALNGKIGHVDDFIVDDETWHLRYVAVDTRTLLPGKKVLIAPKWVKSIDWEEQHMVLDLKKKQIENAPLFDPTSPINRKQETRLYDYYGRPAYWL